MSLQNMLSAIRKYQLIQEYPGLFIVSEQYHYQCSLSVEHVCVKNNISALGNGQKLGGNVVDYIYCIAQGHTIKIKPFS